MEHPGPWSTYGQHYPRLGGGATGNPLAQTPQLNDQMGGYGPGTTSTLLLPPHHGLNAQAVTHADTTNFVNTANHLLSGGPYHESMLPSFPPPPKGHHPLPPLNMAPHTHGSALFKPVSKETEINELRGGFSRRSTPGLSPTTSPVVTPGLFNSQSSPHSWRPPEIMPTPSSPFGVLPHEAVMHRSNVESSSLKNHSTQTAKGQMTETPSYVDADPHSGHPHHVTHTHHHSGYRNMLGQSGGLLDGNNPRPTLMMPPPQQGDVAETLTPLTPMKAPEYGMYHGGTRNNLLPQNYLTHSQFPPLDMNQSVCKNDGSYVCGTMKSSTGDLFVHATTTTTTTQAASPMPAHSRSPVVNSVTSVASPSGSQPRDLSTFATFNTNPTIPTHSQSFLANHLPSPLAAAGLEYSSGTIMADRSAMIAPSQSEQERFLPLSAASVVSTSTVPQVAEPLFHEGVQQQQTDFTEPILMMDKAKMKVGSEPNDNGYSKDACMMRDGLDTQQNKQLVAQAESVIFGNQVGIHCLVPPDPLDGLDAKDDHKRKRRRRRRTIEGEEENGQMVPRITPMTPVQANKLAHKMAPPASVLSVPLHHPPVASPLAPIDLSSMEVNEGIGHSIHLGKLTDTVCTMGDGVSVPSSLSPDGVQMSPPQLPATPASNPGSVAEKSPQVSSAKYPLGMSIEDDLGFLAELPPACNIRLQKRNIIGRGIASHSGQGPKTGTFLDSFVKFVKGNTGSSPSRMLKPSGGGGRGRGRTPPRIPVKASYDGVELNPSTGLFVPRQTRSPKGDTKEFESTVTESQKVAGKETPEVPNPEAPKFSSDEDFSPLGLDSLVHSAIRDLSDAEDPVVVNRSTTGSAYPQTDEKANGHVPVPEKVVDPIRIKLVGLQSGCVQPARRGRGRTPRKREAVAEVDEEMDELPLRRLSMRKCKEVVIQRRQEQIVKKTLKEEKIADFVLSSDSEKEAVDYDSESDPAWTPVETEKEADRTASVDSDEEKRQKRGGGVHKRTRRRSSTGSLSRRGRHNKRSRYQKEREKEDDDEGEVRSFKGKPTRKPSSDDDVLITSAIVEPIGKTGDFVVAVADLSRDNPPIWRIDGKSLLQKFEAFDQNGKVFYKNKSTYAGWTNSNRMQYQAAPVQVMHSNRHTTIVEYLKEKMSTANEEETTDISDERETETDLVPPKESFEVYLQTLISQVLDPNFVSEIIKEQDEYFLSHVHVIDTLVERCKAHVLDQVDWQPHFKDIVEGCPSLVVGDHLDDVSKCQVCQQKEKLQLVAFTWQCYDYVTLALQMVTAASPSCEYKLCSRCADVSWLYSQVHHQKFNFYNQCAAKVSEMREADPTKESHIILQFCLLDGPWINKLLKEVQGVWHRCMRLRR